MSAHPIDLGPPGGVWRGLLTHALILIDEIAKHGISEPLLTRHRDVFLQQIRERERVMRAQFNAIEELNFRPSFDEAVQEVSGFLSSI